MYKYRIYLIQIDFFHFLRDGFQGHLEIGQFVSADSEILPLASDAAKTLIFILKS